MGTALPLRKDFYAARLRDLAHRSRDGAQNRRLLALAVIYDGHRRSDAARFAGVGLQSIRDWVLRFNAEGSDGLKDRKAAGPARKLSEEQRAALAMIVESGPDPALHGVVRWRRCDLAAWLKEQFDVSLRVLHIPDVTPEQLQSFARRRGAEMGFRMRRWTRWPRSSPGRRRPCGSGSA